MYKIYVDKNKVIKSFKSLVILFLGLTLILFSNATEIQQYLSKKANNMSKNIQELPSKTELGNIYDQAYKVAESQDLKATKESVEYLSLYLNQTWGCSISNKDMYNLFSNSPRGKLIQRWGQHSGDDVELNPAGYAKACSKLMKCVNGGNGKDEDYYNTDSYTSCMNIVTNAYDLHKQTFDQYNQMTTSNLGDDMFANGSTQDSSFDLLVDVENIGKLLFNENKNRPEYGFYGESKSGGSEGGESGKASLSSSSISEYVKSLELTLFKEGGKGSGGEVDSCMENCKDVAKIDQAMCKMICSCEEVSSELDILSVKFCLVNSQKKGVEDGKTVLSIEEMLDEMKNIVTNMKESGELMKHKHTDEFMETALQDVDLDRLFAFDFVLEHKPNNEGKEKEPKEQEKKDEEEAKKQNKKLEESILEHFGDLTIESERNKHLVLWNNRVEEGRKKPAGEFNTRENNIQDSLGESIAILPDSENIEDDSQKMVNFTVMDHVGEFMEKNRIAWQSIATTLEGFKKSSKSLELKVKEK